MEGTSLHLRRTSGGPKSPRPSLDLANRRRRLDRWPLTAVTHDSAYRAIRPSLEVAKLPGLSQKHLCAPVGPAGRGRGPYGEARRQAGLRAKPSTLRSPDGIARARRARAANLPRFGDRTMSRKYHFVIPSGSAAGARPRQIHSSKKPNILT